MSLAPQPVTASELASVREQLIQAGLNPATASVKEISKVVEVKGRRARTYRDKFRNAIATGSGSSQEHTKDVWVISEPKTRINTVDDLLASYEVDTVLWEVERFIINKWDMGCVVNEQPTSHQLFQIKVWLKKRKIVEAVRNEVDLLKEEAKKEARVYPAIRRPAKGSGYMLEISIPDLHAGKLCWGPETNGDNYDVKLAEKVFEEALETLLERTSHYPLEEIVFVVGNDLLHVDSAHGTTTAGTPQDVDGRFHKTYVTARLMMTRAIERLRELAPVKVKIVPGNHDQISCFCLGDSLQCQFHNCPDVEIDNAPNSRKYHRFGDVLLMYCHGDGGKAGDYPLVMATERSRDFGETKFREAHVGHTHQLKVQEVHGVRIRTSPALCPADAWHSSKMYINNQRSAEAFLWSKTEGMIASAIYTVPTNV